MGHCFGHLCCRLERNRPIRSCTVNQPSSFDNSIEDLEQDETVADSVGNANTSGIASAQSLIVEEHREEITTADSNVEESSEKDEENSNSADNLLDQLTEDNLEDNFDLSSLESLEDMTGRNEDKKKVLELMALNFNSDADIEKARELITERLAAQEKKATKRKTKKRRLDLFLEADDSSPAKDPKYSLLKTNPITQALKRVRKEPLQQTSSPATSPTSIITSTSALLSLASNNLSGTALRNFKTLVATASSSHSNSLGSSKVSSPVSVTPSQPPTPCPIVPAVKRIKRGAATRKSGSEKDSSEETASLSEASEAESKIEGNISKKKSKLKVKKTSEEENSLAAESDVETSTTVNGTAVNTARSSRSRSSKAVDMILAGKSEASKPTATGRLKGRPRLSLPYVTSSAEREASPASDELETPVVDRTRIIKTKVVRATNVVEKPKKPGPKKQKVDKCSVSTQSSAKGAKKSNDDKEEDSKQEPDNEININTQTAKALVKKAVGKNSKSSALPRKTLRVTKVPLKLAREQNLSKKSVKTVAAEKQSRKRRPRAEALNDEAQEGTARRSSSNTPASSRQSTPQPPAQTEVKAVKRGNTAKDLGSNSVVHSTPKAAATGTKEINKTTVEELPLKDASIQDEMHNSALYETVEETELGGPENSSASSKNSVKKKKKHFKGLKYSFCSAAEKKKKLLAKAREARKQAKENKMLKKAIKEEVKPPLDIKPDKTKEIYTTAASELNIAEENPQKNNVEIQPEIICKVDENISDIEINHELVAQAAIISESCQFESANDEPLLENLIADSTISVHVPPDVNSSTNAASDSPLKTVTDSENNNATTAENVVLETTENNSDKICENIVAEKAENISTEIAQNSFDPTAVALENKNAEAVENVAAESAVVEPTESSTSHKTEDNSPDLENKEAEITENLSTPVLSEVVIENESATNVSDLKSQESVFSVSEAKIDVDSALGDASVGELEKTTSPLDKKDDEQVNGTSEADLPALDVVAGACDLANSRDKAAVHASTVTVSTAEAEVPSDNNATEQGIKEPVNKSWTSVQPSQDFLRSLSLIRTEDVESVREEAMKKSENRPKINLQSLMNAAMKKKAKSLKLKRTDLVKSDDKKGVDDESPYTFVASPPKASQSVSPLRIRASSPPEVTTSSGSTRTTRRKACLGGKRRLESRISPSTVSDSTDTENSVDSLTKRYRVCNATENGGSQHTSHAGSEPQTPVEEMKENCLPFGSFAKHSETDVSDQTPSREMPSQFEGGLPNQLQEESCAQKNSMAHLKQDGLALHTNAVGAFKPNDSKDSSGQPEVGSVIVEGGVRKSRRIGKLQHNIPSTMSGMLTNNLTIIAAPNSVEDKENKDNPEVVSKYSLYRRV